MMQIHQATKIADDLLTALKPHCKVLDIVGSVARKKQEVKDIEICCIPKTKTVDKNTLFEVAEVEVVIHPDFVKAVAALGKSLKGKADGRYMQIETHYRINLDLFMPDPIDYYRQLAIRTGSAEYSHKVIANAWRKMGWCGTAQGLRMINDCRFIPDANDQRKGKWICTKEDPYLPPQWKSEREFFQWLNVTYREPSKRRV